MIDIDANSSDRLNFQPLIYYSCIRGRVDIGAFLELRTSELPSTVRTALQQAIIDLSGTFRVTRERLIRKPHLAGSPFALTFQSYQTR